MDGRTDRLTGRRADRRVDGRSSFTGLVIVVQYLIAVLWSGSVSASVAYMIWSIKTHKFSECLSVSHHTSPSIRLLYSPSSPNHSLVPSLLLHPLHLSTSFPLLSPRPRVLYPSPSPPPLPPPPIFPVPSFLSISPIHSLDRTGRSCGWTRRSGTSCSRCCYWSS